MWQCQHGVYGWDHCPDCYAPPQAIETCGDATWVVSLRKMGDGVYAVHDGGELSLRDDETLTSLLNQLLKGKQP